MADERAMSETRRRTAAWMVCVVGAGWLSGPVLAQAPIHRKFEVRQGGGGFVVYGFRAEKGSKNRFYLTPGMDAEAVRGQLRSVDWDSFSDRLSEKPPRATARRRHHAGDQEAVEVWLDEPDGTVWRVSYEVAPARYSRGNLERLFKSAFGKGRRLSGGDSAMSYEVGGKGKGRGLRMDARLVSSREESLWHLRYVFFDLTLKPSEEEEAAPVVADEQDVEEEEVLEEEAVVEDEEEGDGDEDRDGYVTEVEEEDSEDAESGGT